MIAGSIAHQLSVFRGKRRRKDSFESRVSPAMLEAGRRVKFFNALALVQQLQQDKQQLLLQSRLKKLDRYDLLILDDLGYVQKSESETSVLFELFAFGVA